MKNRRSHTKRVLPLVVIALVAVVAVVAVVVGGCGGNGGSGGSGATNSSGASARVLPVAKNPISNTSTVSGLTITKALVENNVSPATGKPVDDHLEVALKNTSAKPLAATGIYFKVSDPKKGVSEGYYTKLNAFTIEPGATRVAHFDATGAKDHYPVNKYSLYYTDKNALVVDVMASADGAKPATFTVKKDAGGAEAGVE